VWRADGSVIKFIVVPASQAGELEDVPDRLAGLIYTVSRSECRGGAFCLLAVVPSRKILAKSSLHLCRIG